MASTGKRKTTMSKLNREAKLRERRVEKQARKRLRKLGPPLPVGEPNGTSSGEQE
jgi:hypothetical protein